MTTPVSTAQCSAGTARVIGRSLVCAYSSLTRDGRPITWPVTPYIGDRGTIDITTGLTYPDKAERARRDPRVALLFDGSHGIRGSGSADESDTVPIVLVEGVATVRDADLQANTDRYVRDSLTKTGSGFAGVPWFVVKRMGWYFARVRVEVTPTRIRCWADGDLNAAPETWVGPPTIEVPSSDPAPTGPRLPSRSAPPGDWRPFADRAALLGPPVVTVVSDGAPLPVPARSAIRTESGFDVRLPAGIEGGSGPVCLTFHRHGAQMRWQENVVLVGTASGGGGDLRVRVDRALNDWSLACSPLQRNLSFVRAGRTLGKRVAAESARRGQPVPTVRRTER